MPRLPVSRIAITAPPGGWFHGIHQVLFAHYRAALVDLGISVFDVPVETFLVPDAGRIAMVVSRLRAFRPQIAFGLPYGSYALLCRLPAERDGTQRNVFTDVLDIPTICPWDHAPVEFADQLLAPHPEEPASSSAGAIDRLRSVLAHPRLIHWSRDSGQTRIMRELGLLASKQLIREMPPLVPGFEQVETTSSQATAATARVAFVGRFYQEPPAYPDAGLIALANGATETFVDSPDNALWDLLTRRIGALTDTARRRLAMDIDQTYFWRFAHQLVCHHGQTALRLRFMEAAGVPVSCYGNLRMDSPGVPRNIHAVPCNIPYGPQLARLFARHAITLDVLNPGFVAGYSHKQVHGFASGGFMLINRKQDFVDAFGDAGEAVSCATPDEVAAKVDRFLGNPRLRREVGDAIRATIAARFRLKDVLSRVLHAASACVETASAGATGMSRASVAATSILDLLPTIRCEPHWSGASVQRETGAAVVTTAPMAWSYAASIRVSRPLSDLHQPHVRVRLRVDEGRIGIAAMLDDDGALSAEQLISATTAPLDITIELPHAGVSTVIVRNTVDGPSRAVLLQASLCDRVPHAAVSERSARQTVLDDHA